MSKLNDYTEQTIPEPSKGQNIFVKNKPTAKKWDGALPYFLLPSGDIFYVSIFFFVIAFGRYEWLFMCIATRYADKLVLIDARDAP